MSAWRSYFVLTAVVGFLIARPATAADWAISRFHSAVTVQSDASIDVTETIEVNFFVPKHGIFRDLPFRYATDRADRISVPIELDEITLDGGSVPYEQSSFADTVRWKIGDPDRTISGEHTYSLRYRALAAVNFFDDYDELYWNVTGSDWEVPIRQVDATVRLPGQVPINELQSRCFTGAVGSKSEECRFTTDISSATFASNDYLTVVVGWPTGVVTKPGNYDQLRQGGGLGPGWRAVFRSGPAVIIGDIALPLILAVWLWRYWKRQGRDPAGPGTVIAQYDPPPGMTPGEMGVLFDERANQRDVVATIIDLAVRGYVDITETKEKKLLGLAASTDYELRRRKRKDDPPLRAHERQLLSGLFADGDSVRLSELKGAFADDVRAIQSDLYRQVAEQGYFLTDPSQARVRAGLVGGGVLVLGLVVAFTLFPQLGLAIIGLLIIVFAGVMPKRTSKGVTAFWHARGFKLFLEKAEKYRLQWQERQNIFEQYLPYAMAFGVAEKWSQAFAGLNQPPPSWYHGSYPGSFNSLMLWSAMNSFSARTLRSFAPPAASGSSGFGGGGFSGGGFGGGGGGSW
ncbi:MAG: DUF2207 domain-containing protein [Candidatus Kerfeldbacteria bacterium]|nr:DUF2207 domain-containing protein [Candidatus Kerfeldbacteria bacterium]